MCPVRIDSVVACSAGSHVRQADSLTAGILVRVPTRHRRGIARGWTFEYDQGVLPPENPVDARGELNHSSTQFGNFRNTSGSACPLFRYSPAMPPRFPILDQ